MGSTIDIQLTAADFRGQLSEDVLPGLATRWKWLPSKWFYDAQGSKLFEAITELPEYYPTRIERALL